MKITPAILAAAYELLKETPPFDRWNLPPAEDVIFKITRQGDRCGDYLMVGGHHRIRISARKHAYLPTVLETLAHEAVHLHMEHSGMRGGDHGAAFKKLAALVCRHHGFDPEAF